MNKLKTLALDILEIIDKKKDAYDKINSEIKKIQPDFSTHLFVVDYELEGKFINLLDEILGSEIASYYLYECKNMKNGGIITDKGKEFKIKSIADVKKYLDFLKK